jgi:hypothetical protein
MPRKGVVFTDQHPTPATSASAGISSQRADAANAASVLGARRRRTPERGPVLGGRRRRLSGEGRILGDRALEVLHRRLHLGTGDVAGEHDLGGVGDPARVELLDECQERLPDEPAATGHVLRRPTVQLEVKQANPGQESRQEDHRRA